MPCKPLYCTYGKLVIPQRYVLCFMTFFAVLMSYTMRTCLHIAITEMVIPPPKVNESSKGEICPDVDKHTVEVKGGTYNWTEKQQGLILSAFFPGYVISHVPGGFMADVFGAKHIMSGGIALSGLFTVLTPLAVKVGDWWLLMVIRFIIGLSQGPLIPCILTLLSKWVPKRERSGLGAFVTSGNTLGSIAGNLVSSMLMAYINWPMVFYFWGIMALIWYVIFVCTCYSQPSQHPFVTPEEAQMLQQEIGGENAEYFRNRKGYLSLNVQVVGDATLHILDLVARWPGSTHDQTIFNNSYIHARFEANEFNDCLIMGDSGYALTRYLITPMGQPATQGEQLFNEAQIRSRNPIERLFGVWKRRFPILSLGIRLSLNTAKAVIIACAVLHNIATDRSEEIPPDDQEVVVEEEEEDDDLPQQPNIVAGGNWNFREPLIAYFTDLEAIE